MRQKKKTTEEDTTTPAPLSAVEEPPSPPVKVGQVILGVADRHGKKDPYVSYNGFVVFCKKTRPGHEGMTDRYRVTAVKERYAFAEVVE